MRSFLVCLLAGLPLFSHPPALSLDLSGDWRWRLEDRLEFALPDYDDRGWETRRLPLRNLPSSLTRSADPRPVGVWWLRRTVDLPEWVDLSQLALNLGGQWQAGRFCWWPSLVAALCPTSTHFCSASAAQPAHYDCGAVLALGLEKSTNRGTRASEGR